MKRGFIWRIRFITALFTLAAVALIGKLYLVQVVRGEEFAARADRQYIRPAGGVFDRGSIFFADSDLAAATLQEGFILALNPSLLEDPSGVYEQLSRRVPLERGEFDAKASKKNDPYEELARRVPDRVGREIAALELQGVILERERWRFYPGGVLGAHTLGFVGFDGNVLRGRYGLERYYEDVLSRTESSLYANFFAEILQGVRTAFGNERAAGDLITTLNADVERELERTLKTLSERWGVRKAGGIIMDPNTGELYALGVYPAFDPNAFNEVQDQSIFGNPLVESVFEMGSIVKPLTVAAGLDAGVITADTTYVDNGFIESDGATIRNFDGKARGRVPVQEILNQSLNTGVSFIVGKLGKERFSDYMKKFGVGEETGIDLPGEVPGLVSNLESPRWLEHYTASFGQGVAFTPIATVRALGALANNGRTVTPHLVKAIRQENGIVRTISHGEGKQVIRPETAQEISRMLTVVVDEALVEGGIKLEGHSVAAKTGTAQIAKPSGGGYYDDRFLHTFFGYFPSYNPQFILFLFALEPQGARYASQTLTEPFHELTEFLINYYEIPPDR